MMAAQALHEAVTAAALLLAIPAATLIGCVIRGILAEIRKRGDRRA